MPKQVTRQSNRDGEVRYEVLEHLGTIGNYQTGWKKEVNIIEWNGNPSKLDIRDWSPDHQHLSRGITLHRNEILELMRILLKNYGQELKEIERREHRRESAEPRRNPMKASGTQDEDPEAGLPGDISSDERNRQEAEPESGAISGATDTDGQEESLTRAEDTEPAEEAETLLA